MVNLRLCKTARPRFQTLRPRQTLLRFHDLAKFEEPFYTPKRGLITPVHEAPKILCYPKCNYLLQYLVNNQIKRKH